MVYLLIATFVFGAAITSTCVLAIGAMFPGVMPLRAWAVLHAVAAFLIVGIGRYELFERIMKVFAAFEFGTVILLGSCWPPAWATSPSGSCRVCQRARWPPPWPSSAG